MLKTLLLIAIVIAVFSIFGILIPSSFTTEIDNNIVYFLNYIYALDGLFDVAVLMTCIEILIQFYIGVAVFWIFHWVVNIIK